MMKHGVVVNCQTCGKEKEVILFYLKRNKNHYCSVVCYNESKFNRHPPVSAFKKGYKPWNYGKKLSKEVCQKLSISHKGTIPWIKGKHHTLETRIKLSNLGKKRNSGKTQLRATVYSMPEYKKWRFSVFKRDGFKCLVCGDRWLEAHHCNKPVWRILKENNICSFLDAIKCRELWDISNGKTLCKPCHRKWHKENGRKF